MFNWDDFIPDPNEGLNSCDLHKISHEDTEILGYFCDKTNIHGEQLKQLLTLGLLEFRRDL